MTKVYQHLNHITKNSFCNFTIRSFKEVDPIAKFQNNWHIEYLCDLLEQVRSRKIKRLIINIPPRNLKSIICSVSFPAWILGHNPSEKIIVCSYSHQLAIKHSTDTKLIMNSTWYKELFPDSILGSKDKMNTKNKFITVKNGYRFATSIGSTLTGEGGNILIVDDPHHPSKIYNAKERNKVSKWFTDILLSRLNDKENGVVIIVMQRLHLEDLTGFLKANYPDEWLFVNIPAIATEKITYQINDTIYKIRNENDVLNSNYENFKCLMKLRKNMGQFAFETQYQQNPYITEGNIIKLEWLQYVEQSKIKIEKSTFFISIDCASGLKKENDFTVMSIFCEFENIIYLYNIVRDKFEYPDLKNEILKLHNIYKPENILIENASNGISLIQDLKYQLPTITIIQNTKSKEARVNSIVSFLSEKKMFIVKDNKWNKVLEEELLSFPFGKHDDQVDSISQFINWYIQLQMKRIEDLKYKPHFRLL